MSETQWQCPPGIVACTSWGLARTDTAFWLLEMRSCCEELGIKNVQWVHVPGALVDKARNDTLRSLLASKAEWVCMIDLDMTGPREALAQILETAYARHPEYDVVGAYCTLRGDVNLPTIDTGTGTWESHYPGQGVIGVMRTGAAFLLIKRHVAERVAPPWFALRVPQRPLDAIAEIDTYCRTIFDGRNPFRDLPSQAWERMTAAAANAPSAHTWVPAEVGEDSSFCDRVTAAGLRIGVQTDLVIQHLTTVTQGPTDHRKAMDHLARQHRLLSGMLG